MTVNALQTSLTSHIISENRLSLPACYFCMVKQTFWHSVCNPTPLYRRDMTDIRFHLRCNDMVNSLLLQCIRCHSSVVVLMRSPQCNIIIDNVAGGSCTISYSGKHILYIVFEKRKQSRPIFLISSLNVWKILTIFDTLFTVQINNA